ncbi:MAG: D-alanyl-D-alanine carboxypeptidase/D-alanyl-D-alanine-endopeptidase [Actinomycetota bacterium]|nr:D-alanyl-D-alanine carboxypeptidase/D-alanyl-D-alanine-endopeptidase [Actinomycetota bacterium]
MRRRLLLPLFLLTVALLAGLQAQRTDRASAAWDLRPGAEPLRADTPLFSIRRLPEFLQAPTADRRLREAVSESMADFPAGTCLSVAEHGRDLVAVDAEAPMVPASAQKLLTGLAVLRRLGPDASLVTRVLADRTPVDGVLDGDLWLVGGGDPLLMTTEYAARFGDPEPYTDLSVLAKAVADAGVRVVEGAVVGDESRYDPIRYLGTWHKRFKPGYQIQSGPLSALSVDDGFVDWHPVNTASSLAVPADDPAEQAARIFDDLLEEQGIVIRRRADSGTVPIASPAITLVEVPSAPMSAIIEQMLVESDNTTAELLIKELGAVGGEEGTTVRGLRVLEEVLAEAGHPMGGVVPQDGSGLDDDNRVTCRLLASLLNDRVHGSTLVDALPVAGSRGTMEKRFVGTAGEGRVRAKTGTLNNVVSLAGVADTTGGRRLAFALVSNGELPTGIRDLHEEVVLSMLSYPDGPPAEVLGPRPAIDPLGATTSGG